MCQRLTMMGGGATPLVPIDIAPTEADRPVNASADGGVVSTTPVLAETPENCIPMLCCMAPTVEASPANEMPPSSSAAPLDAEMPTAAMPADIAIGPIDDETPVTWIPANI